jgi:hypothetical protein
MWPVHERNVLSLRAYAANVFVRTRGIQLSVPEPDDHALETHFIQVRDILAEAVDTLRPFLDPVRQAYGIPQSVWVLSTARCGTLALARFLEQSPRLPPLHRNHANVIEDPWRLDMFYRIWAGYLGRAELQSLARRFLLARLPDVLRAAAERKVLVGVSHADSPFCPVIRALFPDARFIHLRRDVDAVVRSFIEKGRYVKQLRPLYITRRDAHRLYYMAPPWPIERRVRWYIDATNRYCETFGADMTLDSESLFSATPEAFATLAEIMPLEGLTYENFHEYFRNGGKVND